MTEARHQWAGVSLDREPDVRAAKYEWDSSKLTLTGGKRMSVYSVLSGVPPGEFFLYSGCSQGR